MKAMCDKLRPSTCLDAIAGDFTGNVLEWMGFGATNILYGLLSDMPAGNIQAINFLGKNQTLESFILFPYLATKGKEWIGDMFAELAELYKSELKSEVNASYGLHQIQEALEFYTKNPTSGKVLLKPSLTKQGEKETKPFKCDMHFAKL